MGNAFSDGAASAFPSTGTAITVRINCSHNGSSLDISQYKNCSVTTHWTAGHFQEPIERLTGVHRQCQRLMYAGKVMDRDITLERVTGFKPGRIPDRVALFLVVDRDRFPQKLGPFRPVRVPFEADDFILPELTDLFRKCGFYWEMRTGILEGYGLSARVACIIGQVSPIHPVTMDAAQRDVAAVPAGAEQFVWSYPVADWERVENDAYAMDRWVGGFGSLEGSVAMKSFLSVGGYIYFDSSNRIVGVTTLGRPQEGDEGGMHFAEPRKWLPEWTTALVEHGRFQRVTMRSLEELGARMNCWLRPGEVIEDTDGTPLPTQPDVPHGAFVYLFHKDVLSKDEADVALDRYFPALPVLPNTTQPKADIFRPYSLVDGNNAIFRPYSLVDGDNPLGQPQGYGNTAHDVVAMVAEGKEEDADSEGSFQMTSTETGPSPMASPERGKPDQQLDDATDGNQ